jgi:hypothetical protein
MKQWSTLTLQREFRVVKICPRIYDVCCIKDVCSFRVYAYMGKWDNYIQVKEVKGHTYITSTKNHANKYECNTQINHFVYFRKTTN